MENDIAVKCCMGESLVVASSIDGKRYTCTVCGNLDVASRLDELDSKGWVNLSKNEVKEYLELVEISK